jgi:phage tail-like protein
MDANGSRFHLLLGRDDWGQSLVDGRELRSLWEIESPLLGESAPVVFVDERAELTLRPRVFRFVAAPKDTRPDLSNRRGAARDRYGNWYWIDESGLKIRVRSAGSRQVSDFWSAAIEAGCCKQSRPGDFQARDVAVPAPPLPLSGLAITEDHYLVVGVLEPAGLLVFDLHSNGAPRQLLWPPEVSFKPFDMSPRVGGGVWILDRFNRRYWGLDCCLNLICTGQPDLTLGPDEIDEFQPLEPSGPPAIMRRSFRSGISLELASPLQVIDPIAIEALPDGTVLILDFDPDPNKRFSKIYRYDLAKRIGELSTEEMLPNIELDQASDFRLRGYDIAFVLQHVGDDGKPVGDRVYVAADDGNQSYAFSLSRLDGPTQWHPVADFFPMRLFGGKALVSVDNRPYYDSNENWIPLVAQRRPRYVEEATLTTKAFDSGEPDCTWHRLMIDGCVPPETSVEIWSRAANELIDLELTAWRLEPRLHLRGDGSELPFVPRRQSLSDPQAAPVTRDGTWELLFQNARGRFLQLQLRLRGNERTTPHLRALRAYFPRFSYLEHYLPSVYREDEQSASFLERFLANLEGLYTTLEDKIAAVQTLFDVRSAPTENLAWLAQWFGIVFDPIWDEATRRLLIRHAMVFFQFRGTIHGLKMALHLALDSCANEEIFALPTPCAHRSDSIRIVEKYLTRRTPGIVFGDTSEWSNLRSVLLTARWQPSQGGAILDQLYTDFLNASSTTPPVSATFPFAAPVDTDELSRWEEFTKATLGFVPSSGSAQERIQWQLFLSGQYKTIADLNNAHKTSYDDWPKILLPRDWPVIEKARKDWKEFLDRSQGDNNVRVWWQEFLARRYRNVRALNQDYNTNWPSFEAVSLFDTRPPDGAPLADWYQFEGVEIQMHRTAHRFTVLLPAPVSPALGPEDHQTRLELSRRIIELEKPAHTVFDVKFYWAMFRIGEARLELDTLIDRGSRAPQLLPRMVLDRGSIGESYLGAPVPEDAPDRYILGRDPL